jgi:hypothetical protein
MTCPPAPKPCLVVLALALAVLTRGAPAAETIAFWAFDEPVGLYPSSVISDHGPQQMPLILGPGGSIVPGKFGNALSARPQAGIKLPPGSVRFGLTQVPTPAGRTVEPLSWMNARFAALMTAGENHLRKEFPHPNATTTALNLGAHDWTVEFWYRGEPRGGGDGVVFEAGEGPRGENSRITALLLAADRSGFVLINQPSGTRAAVRSDTTALTDESRWVHLAFVYHAGRRELVHFVDGRAAGSAASVALKPLPEGAEAYFTVGRDARWERPLPGAIDELRISRGIIYAGAFAPPGSHVENPRAGMPARQPVVTEPLRFAAALAPDDTVNLGSSRHLLLDDALFPRHTNVSFVPTPPRKVELVFEVTGRFRKHLTVVEDEQGLIRIYNPIARDQLGVRTSRDGVTFDIPQLSTADPAAPNVTTTDATGTPSVFIDPLAPPEERWKLVTGTFNQAIYVYTSPDGYGWKRVPTPAISAWSGSQTNMFFDDQRGQYLGYHRTDIGDTVFNKTERRFVMTITDSLRPPWPFQPLSQAEYDRAAATLRIDALRPWYLDNGPLTPGGIGIEWPTVFRPTDGFDPEGTDLYVPKAVKYPWTPDAYLAFPCVYFHYNESGPATRQALGAEERGRGSGPIETQLMTSRDGVDWRRYPRPPWIGLGLTDGFDIHQTYMAHGMVRRGDEIWMYTFNTEEYHSTHRKRPERRGVFRTVHPLDRFVAAESPYDREATLYSRPIVFTGRQLVLNVDTAATGWLQVGIVQGDGRPLPGYELEQCVYVNGDKLRYPVEWLGAGTDVSALAGRPVRLVMRMRGTRLYSLQFTE